MEINITEFVRTTETHDLSGSVAELGQDAGKITWNNAVREASTTQLLSQDDRDEFERWVREFGAWSRDEIEAWSLDEYTDEDYGIEPDPEPEDETLTGQDAIDAQRDHARDLRKHGEG